MPPKRTVLKPKQTTLQKEPILQPFITVPEDKLTYPYPLTLCQEILTEVELWYLSRSMTVPPEEYKQLLDDIKAEKKESEATLKEFLSTLEKPTPVETETPSEDPKKDFWKQYWAKKKAEGYVTKKMQAEQQKSTTK